MNVLLTSEQVASLQDQRAERPGQPLYIVGEGICGNCRQVKCDVRGAATKHPNCNTAPMTPPAGWPAVGSTLPRVELVRKCPAGCWDGIDPTSTIVDFDCSTCEGTGTVPWGSALMETLPVYNEDQPVPHGVNAWVFLHPSSDPDHHGAWLWRIVGSETVGLPLAPASVRPGSFVAILTDIEQA